MKTMIEYEGGLFVESKVIEGTAIILKEFLSENKVHCPVASFMLGEFVKLLLVCLKAKTEKEFVGRLVEIMKPIVEAQRRVAKN